MKRSLLPLLGSLALGFIGLYLVDGPAAFQARSYHLPTVSAPLALAIAAATVAYWIVPALRLQLLGTVHGHALPLTTGLLIHLAGLLSAAITPGGSGSAPAIAAGLRRAGLPLGAAVGMAVQVTVLDLVFFAWALPISLAYLLLSGATALSLDLVALALASMVVALAAAIVLGRHPRPVVRLALWLARKPMLGRFRQRLTAAARGYYRSSRHFATMRTSTWIALQALGALAWLGMFVLFWALVQAFQPLAVLATIATLTIATLVAFIVPTPGGSGFIEVAVGYGIGAQTNHADLATPLLLWRFGTFYLVFLLGPLASWRLFAGEHGRRPPGEPADANRHEARDGL
jgi:uncharacterized protein (TIRG00374 family)